MDDNIGLLLERADDMIVRDEGKELGPEKAWLPPTNAERTRNCCRVLENTVNGFVVVVKR